MPSQDIRGIESLLGKMRRAPDSTMLRERILALLAELVDDEEKVRLTLELADIVRKGDPLSGLRIAHMAYQFDRTNIQALTAIAESLRRLGRDQKADQIIQEIDRLLQSGGKPTSPEPPEAVNSAMAAAAKAAKEDVKTGGKKLVAAIKENQFNSERDDDKTVAISLESLGIEKEKSSKKVEQISPEPDKGKVGGIRFIKDKAAKEKGKRAPEPSNPLPSQDLLDEVDTLMEQGQYFAAMIKLRQAALSEATLDFCVAAMERFPTIWKRLSLKPIQWQKNDGIEIFLRLLRKPQLPNLGGLVVATNERE